ncbi:DUF3040 domain-containing protein (plasmid) [Pseudonocardia bannensis]|uniref:DUF3040 domain-containing protein n=1 Tax=Pseudonocardia bannensis TaxID=630973 RepID=A0A848DR40_9PSEU|nr:DUF3040 domain-containing protein [Pseudonocardia bannensis]NMH95330.1 DUF3040 domain-containing protein [Pseudonocardia bannensis]
MNNHERHVLDEVERQLRTDDPEFVTRFGEGQHRLPVRSSHSRSCPRRFHFSWPVVGLLVLVVGLLVLGPAGPALLVAALAAFLGWLSAVHVEAPIEAEESKEGKR